VTAAVCARGVGRACHRFTRSDNADPHPYMDRRPVTLRTVWRLIAALSGRYDPGICNGIGSASKRILVILVLAIPTPPAQARQTEQARTQFECATTKVIIWAA
jgi:hypothetical protein